MTDETFDRPNKPGIWQREDNMRFFVGRDGDSDSVLINLVLDGNPYTRYSWMAIAVLAVGRYRRIADEFGNPLCDPDEPWPPKTRKEKRRVVQFRYSHDDPDDSARVYYYSVRAEITPCKTVQIICDEIRDCEIGEDGTVIGVWSDSF